MQKVVVAFMLTVAASVCSAQWAKTSLSDRYVYCFAVSGANLFAGVDSGVFLSTNDGTSWTQIGLPTSQVLALAVSGTNLFAGTFGDGVFLSTNSGISWLSVSSGLTNLFVHALLVSGLNLFAGTLAEAGGGIFLSTNNGTSWAQVAFSPSVISFAVSGTNLLTGTRGSGRTCSGVGAFRSTDNGTTWTQTGLAIGDVNSFATSPDGSGGTNLFAGTCAVTWGSGVFLSTNNGTSWDSVNAGLTSRWVHALAVSGTNLFAGGGGVFLSANNGTSWTAVNTGLTETSVSSLAVHGPSLFAGTSGSGVWRRPLSEMITSVEPATSEWPQSFSLEQNYPNPFNPSTEIRYSIPVGTYGHTALRVFDVLGREVATLVDGVQEAGFKSVQWDASGVASGVYLYRLEAGSFVATRKLVVLK